MAKKVNSRPKKQKSSSDKKRRASLFRRISTKIANAEIQQVIFFPSKLSQMSHVHTHFQMASSGALSPIQPSRSLQSFSRSQDTRPCPRLSLSPLDPFYQQVNLSGQSPCNSPQSSPSSSVPNTPTTNLNSSAPVYHQRPSSLHGLKHKLHTIGSGKSPSSSRRKSVCVIPLSPLARTPSPSPCGPSSPTRSPSPLAFCLGHHPAGASNLTQSYTPNQSLASKQQSNTSVRKVNSFKSNEEKQ